jgi:hypothetical protein
LKKYGFGAGLGLAVVKGLAGLELDGFGVLFAK